jgi:hypothetical protein
MNEEQAVLEFFAMPENLSLSLSVAEQMDKLREQMNNRFWKDLMSRINALIQAHKLTWNFEFTEDKNATDILVGLHCITALGQTLNLSPMLEQQYLGGLWRIYFGLRWSAPPSPDQLGLPAVNNLKESLQKAGFKNNESFLAWQWTTFHPRRIDFLLRYANHPEQLLDDIEAIFKTLLLDQAASIGLANAALQAIPHSMPISLKKLRSKLSES